MRNKAYLPIGRYPIYDDVYDHLRMTSFILNTNRNTITEIIWDLSRIKNELFNITGDEKGNVTNSLKENTPSKLKAVKIKLAAIDEKFNSYCSKIVLQGKSKPTELPEFLFEEKCRLDAKYSVLIEERDYLQKSFDNYVEIETKIDLSLVLKNGPRGQGRLSNGILVEIDGMNVSINEDGAPFINDSRSPFDGYLVQDYFTHIVKPYNLAKALKAKENALQAKENNSPIEGITRGNKSGSVAWPKMPAEVKNYKVERSKK